MSMFNKSSDNEGCSMLGNYEGPPQWQDTNIYTQGKHGNKRYKEFKELQERLFMAWLKKNYPEDLL